ncbi:MAG: tetratricopeptide repeat protein [Bacteroidales bacterium]|nr:tetratricopeptide repeat protein [Bacteroidales bacterium]
MKTKILKYSLIIFLLIYGNNIFAQKNEYLLAKIHYQNKNYELASTEIQKYLSALVKNDDALFLSAKINIALKQYKSAIENLSSLNSKKYPELNLLLARAYAGISDKTNSISYLNKYLKLRNKIAADKIIAYPEFGYIADSQEWQDLWAEKHYSKKEKSFIEAQEQFNNGNYQVAENELNSYIVKYDAQAEVLYMKAKIATSQNNYKDALNYIDKAVKLSNNSAKYLKTRAEIEYRLKKYNKALTDYNFALQKDSLDLSVYFQRAQVYSALGAYEKAHVDIEKYLLYYPDNEQALKRYAEIAYAGKDYLSAIRTYGKLIERYPGNTAYFKLRADAYMQTHTYNYAIKDYSMALDIYPRDAEIYYQKGMAHFRLQQTNEACSAWKRAKKYGSNKADRLIYKYCK